LFIVEEEQRGSFCFGDFWLVNIRSAKTLRRFGLCFRVAIVRAAVDRKKEKKNAACKNYSAKGDRRSIHYIVQTQLLRH
jgi:hypothetical protein